MEREKLIERFRELDNRFRIFSEELADSFIEDNALLRSHKIRFWNRKISNCNKEKKLLDEILNGI